MINCRVLMEKFKPRNVETIQSPIMKAFRWNCAYIIQAGSWAYRIPCCSLSSFCFYRFGTIRDNLWIILRLRVNRSGWDIYDRANSFSRVECLRFSIKIYTNRESSGFVRNPRHLVIVPCVANTVDEINVKSDWWAREKATKDSSAWSGWKPEF